ncbi:MAG: hypothetical protein Q7T49_00145 [bacterium]|nr:hypothetical protein [bacterium]
MKLLPVPLKAKIREAYYLFGGEKIDRSNPVYTNAVILGENDNLEQEDCYFGYWDTIQTKRNPDLILLRFPKRGVQIINSEPADQIVPLRKSA